MIPIVAVVADTLVESGYHWHAGKNSYLSAAFEVAGVLPLLVPAFGGGIDFDGLLARVDGVMLTGHKSNVHPKNNGQAETGKHEPFDLNRDATSLALERRAVTLGVPLLAICRGIQEMNVALGGTLGSEIQERPGIKDHREPDTPDLDARYGLRHSVAFATDGKLMEIFDAETVTVNSLHRQAVEKPGDVLQVEARARLTEQSRLFRLSTPRRLRSVFNGIQSTGPERTQTRAGSLRHSGMRYEITRRRNSNRPPAMPEYAPV